MIKEKIKNEIDRMNDEILQNEEFIKLLENYDNLSLVSKIALGCNTNIRHCKGEYINSIIDDFKSKALRGATGVVALNEFRFEIGNRVVIIPTNKSKCIEIRYLDGSENLKFKRLLNTAEIEKQIKKVDEELIRIPDKFIYKENDKLHFGKIKRGKLFDNKNYLNTYLANVIEANHDITLENERMHIQIEEIKAQDINFFLSIKEDLDYFLDNGYTINSYLKIEERQINLVFAQMYSVTALDILDLVKIKKQLV